MRSAVILAVAATAVLAFILILGDRRRRQRALEQATWYAETLAERVGPGGALPINLEPLDDPARRSAAFRLEWLPRTEARRFREADRRCMVARTVPLLQVLGADGRAAVFFENGRFDVEWLTLSEFDKIYQEQRQELRRLSDKARRNPPEAP